MGLFVRSFLHAILNARYCFSEVLCLHDLVPLVLRSGPGIVCSRLGFPVSMVLVTYLLASTRAVVRALFALIFESKQ